MSNLTSVGITSGLGTSGTGTISTLDNLIGTAGTASAQVQTVQGVASMTPVQVSQATAANLNATVVGTGTFAVQSAPTTASAWGVQTQGSTTSGQSGELILGAVTTSAPSYTTAQTSPLSLDTSGNLRVNVVTGGGSGGTSLADEATFTEGTTTFTPVGGVYKSSQTALTTGQAGAAALSAARELNTLGKVWDGTNTAAVKAASTTPVATDPALVVAISPNSVNANGRATPANSAPVVLAKQTYNTVAASQTAQALTGGSGGATGDWLDFLLIVPATTAAGAVSIKDGSGSAITVWAGGGTTALTSLVPFSVPIRAVTTAGAWSVTTGTNVSVIASGNFT